MEGRWAQLAIDAHIAKAIDYSRPIKRFAEEVILARLELARDLQYSALYPARSDDGEGEYVRTASWVEYLKTRLKPWRRSEDAEAEQKNDILDKIAYLESQRKS